MATKKELKENTTLSKEDIRNKIFQAKPANEYVEVFGVEIEVRAPKMSALIDSRQTEDAKERFADAIINYCYVPHTDEKIFTVEDVQAIVNLPAGEDINKLQAAISKVLGGNLATHVKSSEGK